MGLGVYFPTNPNIYWDCNGVNMRNHLMLQGLSGNRNGSVHPLMAN